MEDGRVLTNQKRRMVARGMLMAILNKMVMYNIMTRFLCTFVAISCVYDEVLVN